MALMKLMNSLVVLVAIALSRTSAFAFTSGAAFLRSKSQVLHAKPKVFIDGEAGTTGIQVRDRLAKRDDLEIISAPSELRKDEAMRKKLINEADAVILCKCRKSREMGFSGWLLR